MKFELMTCKLLQASHVINEMLKNKTVVCSSNHGQMLPISSVIFKSGNVTFYSLYGANVFYENRKELNEFINLSHEIIEKLGVLPKHDSG